jgi:hypothetical protein
MIEISIALTFASLVVLIVALIGRNIELRREEAHERDSKLDRVD